MGVQDSDGEGEQRGRSNESAEWHHGQGGDAEKVVVFKLRSAKITLVSLPGGAGRDTMRSLLGRVKGSIMKSALPSTMRI